MKIVIAVMSLVIIGLSGSLFYVTRPVTDVVKSVSYYRENRQELKEQIDKCKDNPGLLAQTPNCQNAFQANQKNMFDPNNSSMPQIR